MLGVYVLAALLAAAPSQPPEREERSLLTRSSSIAESIVGDEDSRYYLQIGGLRTGAGLSLGPGVRVRGLADGWVDLDAVAIVSHKKYLLAEGSLTTAALVRGLRAGVFVRRKYFPQEEFSGIGIESRREDRVNYTYDENAAGAMATLRSDSPWRLEGRFEYRHPDVGRGHDGSYPSIEALFTDAATPGLTVQPDYLVATTSVTYAAASPESRPTQGGRYQVSVSRFWGRGSSTYDFFRVDADLRQYVPIVRERHILVFRGETALTATPGNARVPFYYLPRLGGTSSLRGYRHFRFYDRHSILLQAEYRWRPMRFVETAMFYDVGSVAPRVSRLRDRVLSDYGAGVRFGTESRVFFRLESAFGTPDGPKVYAKFSTEF